MSSNHVPSLTTPHLSISSVLIFFSPSLSSFHIFLVNSYLPPAYYLFLIIYSSLAVHFPLCSLFFSVPKLLDHLLVILCSKTTTIPLLTLNICT